MGCSSSRAHRIEELRRSLEWPLSVFQQLRPWAASGHEERFLPPSLSAGCGFGKKPFGGRGATGEMRRLQSFGLGDGNASFDLFALFFAHPLTRFPLENRGLLL